ncbi:MAG: RHS repeat-associated core domain-containing protein, partial [Steroidobacteraceae bacterium]
HLIATPSGQVQVIRRSDGTTDTLYVTTDHLGSTDAVLDAAGNAVLQGSFAVHGERRAGDWQGPPSSGEWQAIANTTRRGYTGHEMLDNVALIHMNGRVLDPLIGRFLSADPYIDGPLSTQGWNRYAYVQGRVMSAIDPSGFGSTRYQGPQQSNGHGNVSVIIVTGSRLRNNLEALAGFLNRWAISDILDRPQTMDTREQDPTDPGAGPDPAEPQGERQDVGICSEELPVITTAVNLGVGFVSGEFGNVYVVDWKAGAVHVYNYGGLGVGLSIPTLFTGAASIELGAASGVNSRSELTGWGYAVSGFAAVGPKGYAGQYFANFSGGYHGATAGYAAGLGGSLGGIATYTRFDRTFSLDDAPQPIKELISGCQNGG